MTFGWGGVSLPDGWSPSVLSHKESEECLTPMGITSENVAADFGISRETQDKFAAESFLKAAAAQKAGKFKHEIVPVKVTVVDPKTKKAIEVVVDADDGIREGVTAESLSKLKPSFKQDGSTHAGRPILILNDFCPCNSVECLPGNASQVSDGAAAVVLTRRSVAKRLGLPIIGKYVAAAVVGVPPRIMGVGPAYAIPKVLEKTGLSKDDVDFYEINEAFASQAIYSVNKLGIPFAKVNLNGGAIAIGHPLGCSTSLSLSLSFVSFTLP